MSAYCRQSHCSLPSQTFECDQPNWQEDSWGGIEVSDIICDWILALYSFMSHIKHLEWCNGIIIRCLLFFSFVYHQDCYLHKLLSASCSFTYCYRCFLNISDVVHALAGYPPLYLVQLLQCLRCLLMVDDCWVWGGIACRFPEGSKL